MQWRLLTGHISQLSRKIILKSQRRLFTQRSNSNSAKFAIVSDIHLKLTVFRQVKIGREKQKTTQL